MMMDVSPDTQRKCKRCDNPVKNKNDKFCVFHRYKFMRNTGFCKCKACDSWGTCLINGLCDECGKIEKQDRKGNTMKVLLGTEGIDRTFQRNFLPEIECNHCNGNSRLAFVAHELETKTPSGKQPLVCELHENKVGEMWLHDACAVAVYLCRKCLKATAVVNQG